MTTANDSTLTSRTEDLRRHLATVLPPDVLATFDADAERRGAEDFAGRAPGPGAPAPRFALPDATGVVVSLDRFLAQGPVVLTFYRGAWCPYCNLQLHAYQEILPELTRRGATLVAVSPQTPDNSLTMAEKEGLAFTVLSDAGNRVADQYGLAYTITDDVRAAGEQVGLDLAQFNGDATYRLPAVATFVIDPRGTIRFARVSGDYRWRTDPASLIEALDAL
jgi:peroxiredoxin